MLEGGQLRINGESVLPSRASASRCIAAQAMPPTWRGGFAGGGVRLGFGPASLAFCTSLSEYKAMMLATPVTTTTSAAMADAMIKAGCLTDET